MTTIAALELMKSSMSYPLSVTTFTSPYMTDSSKVLFIHFRKLLYAVFHVTIASNISSVNLGGERINIENAAFETLGRQNAQFKLGNVQPTSCLGV